MIVNFNNYYNTSLQGNTLVRHNYYFYKWILSIFVCRVDDFPLSNSTNYVSDFGKFLFLFCDAYCAYSSKYA